MAKSIRPQKYNIRRKYKNFSWPATPFFLGYSLLAIGICQTLNNGQHQPTIEGATNQDNQNSFYDNYDHLDYYIQLNERERARNANMTAKQAYTDVEASYTINLIRIGIMFFMILCVFFTLLNLDAFEGIFSSAKKYRSNIYSSYYD